jgi:hypothetical protein
MYRPVIFYDVTTELEKIYLQIPVARENNILPSGLQDEKRRSQYQPGPVA